MNVNEVETTGAGIDSTVRGFGAFSILATGYLTAEGIGKEGPDGVIIVDKQGWYPLPAYVKAFDRIAKDVGAQVVFQVGMSVVENVQFPPHIRTIEDAMGSLDVAYHMNHRLRGQVMFNPTNGQMMEGIGHMASKPEGPKRIAVTVDTPYQCEFDQGVVQGMAARFQSTAKVAHKPGSCRSKGATQCVYIVAW